MRVLPSLALLLLALPVAAQDPDAQVTEDAEYRRSLEEAVAEYDAGRYAEARALFRRAHDRSPNARTLRGIGMAAFEMREYAEALGALTGALAEQRRPLTDEQRAHVQSLIDRTNAYVGRYRVILEPDGAELLVDHALAPLDDDGTLVLSLGEHQIEARCPGCETQRRTIDVRGGEDEELRFDLGSAGAAGSLETGGAGRDALPSAGDTGEGSDTAAIVMLAGAGVLAAGAIAGVFWWLDRNGELDRCRDAGSACGNEETLESERGVAAGATIAFTAAALVLGTIGIVSLGADDDDDAHVACAPSIGGIHCVTRF